MEAITLKEFYENFSELVSPEPDEKSIEVQLFQAQSFQTENQNTFPATEESFSSNFDNSRYPEINQPLKSNHTFAEANSLLGNVPYNLGNTSSLPSCQPAKHSRAYEGPSNQTVNNNKSLKNFNDRLGSVFKTFDNTNFLSHFQPSTNSQYCSNLNVQVPSTQYLSNKTSENHNYRLSNVSYDLGNANSLSQNLSLQNAQTFPHQYKESGFQQFTGKKTNHYDPSRNTCIRNSTSVPFCQPSTSRQTAINQNGQQGNIYINIGNTTSLSPCRQLTKQSVFSKEYMDLPDTYIEEHHTVPNNPNDTKENMKPNTLMNNISYNASTNILPKTIIKRYVFGPNHSDSTDQGFKITRETINQQSQATNVLETISNIPFEHFTSMTGNLNKTLANPSVNINNINSINVHVHHPSNISPIPETYIQQGNLPLMDQRVPLTPLHNTMDELLWKGPSTNMYSQNFDASICCDETSFMPVNPNSSGTDYAGHYGVPTRSGDRDDIYLPTSSETFQCSDDIDEWLNSIEVTPLEPYSEQESHFTLETKQQVKKIVPNKSRTMKRKNRTRTEISNDTVEILNSWFQIEPYPSLEERQRIADQTGHSVDTIKFWFQNHRQAVKRKRCMESSSYENIRPDPLLAIAKDQNEQPLSTQSAQTSGYPAVYSPQIPFNTLNINDGEINYNLKIDLPLGTY